MKKVRNAGKSLGKKLSKSKVGKALKNSAKKVRDFFKKKRDRMRDDKRQRLRWKKRRRDDRERKEKSPSSKQARLALAVARIRRILRRKLRPGMPHVMHRALLMALRSWYKLSSVTRVGAGRRFTDVAALNPTLPITPGEHAADEEKDYIDVPADPDLPPTRIPDFADNKLARNFKAEYISEAFVSTHGEKQEKPDRPREPIGFRHLNKYDLNTDQRNRWVRMHLLTKRLGGPAKGSNLVPARSRVNTNFKKEVEKYPENWVRSGDSRKKKPVWYRVDLNYHSGNTVGFPSRLRTEWGIYEPNRDRSRRNPEARAEQPQP